MTSQSTKYNKILFINCRKQFFNIQNICIMKVIVEYAFFVFSLIGLTPSTLLGDAMALINSYQYPFLQGAEIIFDWNCIKAHIEVYLKFLSIHAQHSNTEEKLLESLCGLWEFIKSLKQMFQLPYLYTWGKFNMNLYTCLSGCTLFN